MKQLLLGLILASIPVWRPSEAATKEVFKEQGKVYAYYKFYPPI